MAVPLNDEETDRERKKNPHRSTIFFIVIFVTSVLALLIGYRYAIPTRANDWYLFQVASHTSWVLGKVGYHSDVEEQTQNLPPPAEARAKLEAWGCGDDAPTPEAIAATSAEPLSRYERWLYRARSARHGGYTGSIGPLVSFVFRPGVATRIADAESELRVLKATPQPRIEETRRMTALQARIDDLRATEKATPPEEKTFDERFNFTLVPECGAIEVMAIFFSAVIAFPTRFWKRAVGLVLGLPAMYAVNIFRVSCLGIIGAVDNGGKWFRFTHEYVWQAVYIVFVVAVWLLWVEFLVKRKNT